jgi:hypothetical protein
MPVISFDIFVMLVVRSRPYVMPNDVTRWQDNEVLFEPKAWGGFFYAPTKPWEHQKQN